MPDQIFDEPLSNMYKENNLSKEQINNLKLIRQGLSFAYDRYNKMYDKTRPFKDEDIIENQLMEAVEKFDQKTVLEDKFTIFYADIIGFIQMTRNDYHMPMLKLEDLEEAYTLACCGLVLS